MLKEVIYMAVRIVRGTVIGIFLGLLLGISVTRMMKLSKAFDYPERIFEDTKYETDDVMSTKATPDYGLAGISDAVYEVNENPPECNDVEDAILRFHVRANSNREEDLEIKYAVRDAVLADIGNELQQVKSKDEAILFLNDNLERIEKTALEAIYGAGYGYTVKVYISNDYFPIRQYGDIVLPAGIYQALRIDIGLAEGENFWCILYPTMCYTIDSGAVVSKNDEDKLSRELSEEEFEKLFVKRDVKDDEVKIKFKFLEWLGF